MRGRPSVDFASVPITRHPGRRGTLTSQMHVQGAWRHPKQGLGCCRLAGRAAQGGAGWAHNCLSLGGCMRGC